MLDTFSPPFACSSSRDQICRRSLYSMRQKSPREKPRLDLISDPNCLTPELCFPEVDCILLESIFWASPENGNELN